MLTCTAFRHTYGGLKSYSRTCSGSELHSMMLSASMPDGMRGKPLQALPGHGRAPGSTRHAPIMGVANTRPQLFAWNSGTIASTRLRLPSATQSTLIAVSAACAATQGAALILFIAAN